MSDWQPWPCPDDGEPYEVRVPAEAARFFVTRRVVEAPDGDLSEDLSVVLCAEGRLILTNWKLREFAEAGAEWRAIVCPRPAADLERGSGEDKA